jgi:hypothetical protein
MSRSFHAKTDRDRPRRYGRKIGKRCSSGITDASSRVPVIVTIARFDCLDRIVRRGQMASSEVAELHKDRSACPSFWLNSQNRCSNQVHAKCVRMRVQDGWWVWASG